MAHGGTKDVQHGRHTGRRFLKEVTRFDNRPVTVRRATCAACGFVGEIMDNTGSGLLSSEVIKRFSAKNWLMDPRADDDRCPECHDKLRAARRAKRNPNRAPQAVNLKLVTTDGEPTMMNAAPAAEAPASMTRDDRRVIFAKLSDVYIDETSGYQTPWTDAAVAKDLGVPLAWVASIREENFGPAHDNQEIRDMLGRVSNEAGAAKIILAEAKAVRAEGSALVERINMLNRQAIDCGHKLDGLLALADRIQKAVQS